MDLKLSTLDHDIDVSTGDLVLVDRSEAVAQHLRIRLQFFINEWFLDRRIGIPYYQKILVKNPGTNVVRAIMRRVITSTPGVLELRSLSTEYDGTSRKLTVSFMAQVEGSDEPLMFSEEFIV